MAILGILLAAGGVWLAVRGGQGSAWLSGVALVGGVALVAIGINIAGPSS
jgi:hypothetical protein